MMAIALLVVQVGGAGLGPLGPVVIAVVVGWLVVSTVFGGARARRPAPVSNYLLTDRRLLVDGPGAHLNLRLTNLPELRLDAEPGGYGSIYFTQPLGAGPEDRMRSVEWMRRWLPGVVEPTLLIEEIADAPRVFDLVRAAQAEAAAAGGANDGDAGSEPSPIVPVRAPVVRTGLRVAAAEAPPWFGALLLIAGLAAAVSAAGASVPLLIIVLFPGSFALLGAFFLLSGLNARWRTYRLKAPGPVVPGRVLAVAATGATHNDVEMWVVRFRYEVGGTAYDGQSHQMPWVSAARYGINDPVRVRYRPEQPGVSELID
jgi:hypothetical protein